MASGSSRTLASRARAVVGRALGATSSNGEPDQETPEQTAVKKAPAKKVATKKVAAKKAPVKKSVAKSAPAKKTSAQKSSARKSPAKKSPAASPASKSTTSSSEKTTATKKAPAAPAKTAPATTTKAAPRARKGSPGALVVLPAEKPWTKDELDAVKAHLRDDVRRLTPELDDADHELHDLMVDAGDGAGADQADIGSSSFERDQGLTIANNTRDMLEASQHALERIADGSYGVCESCGEPIGKKRLMAFPRATLCMTCKQREERH